MGEGGDQLNDEFLDVSNLLARYCWIVDEKRFDDWSMCFKPDGVFRVGGQAYSGRAAIAEFVSGSIGDYRLIRHLTYHPEIVFTSKSEARARCYFSLVAITGDGRDIQALGRYDDRLELTADGWAFAERQAAFDFFAPRTEGWGGDAGRL
jgi:SnoaL-like domain